MFRRAIERPGSRPSPQASLVLAIAFAARCASSAGPRAAASDELVEVTSLDPTIQVELAGSGAASPSARPLARARRVYLIRRAAEALARANRVLAREKGYQLLVRDASEGCAVEVSLYDPADHVEADMSAESASRIPRIATRDPSATEVNRAYRRELLRNAMEGAGFRADPARWSRFTFGGTAGSTQNRCAGSPR